MSPSFSSLNLVLLGPPGSGKGTQATLLAERYRIPRISTGEMLRDEVQRGSDLGREVEAIVNRGELVSDRLVAGMVLQRLDAEDCARGFVLDGFPRNVEQAALLDGVLAELGRTIERALVLEVPDEVIVKRIGGRRIHPGSGRVYHVDFNPPQTAGKDDLTGEPLELRKDDREETVRERLRVYHRAATALVEFYRLRGLSVEIDGNCHPDEVSRAVGHAIEAPVSA
ncbi:MAG: adenylate kinase [Thermoanaerobaculales bacterium]